MVGSPSAAAAAAVPKVKRDRWASSSSSEDDDDDKRRRRKKNNDDQKKKRYNNNNNNEDTTKSSHADIPEEGVVAAQQQHLPRHNPLLQGCRSVYDTYERLKRVSEGTYGVVWQARDLATNEIVALKQIKFHAQATDQSYYSTTSAIWKEGFAVTALREISVLMALSPHESIVSVKEMVVGDAIDKVFMVMEFFDCDLKDALARQATGNPLAQSELKGILQQILAGTEHMHAKWYLHRDLKPSNILVQLSSTANNTGRIALADFGLARRYQDPAVLMTIPVVTLWYRAPELLFGEQHYGPSVDMWSIGCIMGELIKSGGTMKAAAALDDEEESEEDDSNAIMKGQGEIDQIDHIFSMVGTPNEQTWPLFDKLPNASFLRWKPVDTTCLLPLEFPIAASTSSKQTFLDANGYHLLQSLLCLDPSQRITAKAARDHAYFHQGVAPKSPNFSSDNCQRW